MFNIFEISSYVLATRFLFYSNIPALHLQTEKRAMELSLAQNTFLNTKIFQNLS